LKIENIKFDPAAGELIRYAALLINTQSFMNRNYTLSFEDFKSLLDHISRHHIYQIADDINLIASSKNKVWRFIDNEGRTIPEIEVFERIEHDRILRRKVYNLFMSYFR
jgi:hypothetical protein